MRNICSVMAKSYLEQSEEKLKAHVGILNKAKLSNELRFFVWCFRRKLLSASASLSHRLGKTTIF